MFNVSHPEQLVTFGRGVEFIIAIVVGFKLCTVPTESKLTEVVVPPEVNLNIPILASGVSTNRVRVWEKFSRNPS
jgi:hypothetical protein